MIITKSNINRIPETCSFSMFICKFKLVAIYHRVTVNHVCLITWLPTLTLPPCDTAKAWELAALSSSVLLFFKLISYHNKLKSLKIHKAFSTKLNSHKNKKTLAYMFPFYISQWWWWKNFFKNSGLLALREYHEGREIKFNYFHFLTWQRY